MLQPSIVPFSEQGVTECFITACVFFHLGEKIKNLGLSAHTCCGSTLQYSSMIFDSMEHEYLM